MKQYRYCTVRNIFDSWSNQNEVELSRNNYYYVLEALHTITYSEETDSNTVIEARALLINWTLYGNILSEFIFLHFQRLLLDFLTEKANINCNDLQEELYHFT